MQFSDNRFAANGAVCSALIGFTRFSLFPPRPLFLALILSLTHSLCHIFLSSIPLFLSFFRSLARWSAYPCFSFHSRDNFPHPCSFGEETRQNVIVYVIWILQHFTCPGFSDAAVFVARKSNGTKGPRVVRSVETGRRDEDLTKWDQWTTCSKESHISE